MIQTYEEMAEHVGKLQSELKGFQVRETLLAELLKKHQENQHTYYGGPAIDQLKQILGEYKNKTADTIRSAKEFRDRLLVDFRALELMLTGVANAETHREKNARLRAVLELLSGASARLRQDNFEFIMTLSWERDIFACDFPSREFHARIRELENELQTLKTNGASPDPSAT
jgi:hypothetical protein